jgi:carbon monoxide dehydrogenase subunit G
MKVEVETEIAAPPHVVYATATDIEQWQRFIRGIERLEILNPGPLAVGTKFRETRTMFGRTATEEMTVSALTPPGRFDLTAESHGTRYHAHHEITATPGGSRLKLVFEGTAVTFGAKLGMLIGMLFKGAVKKHLQTDMEDIKAEAERRAHTG